MHKILFTTIHPAPYMDLLFKEMEKVYYLDVLYNKSRSSNKKWEHYEGYAGKTITALSWLKIISLIRDKDLIVIGGWGSLNNLILIFLCSIFRKTCVVFSDYPDISRTNHLKTIIKKLLILPQINYLLCATKSTANYYNEVLAVNKNKIKVFPYIFEKLKEETTIRKIDGTNPSDSSKIKVFVANNFIERKGYSILIEAVKLLDKSNYLDNFQFTIAGTGPLFDSFKTKFWDISRSICLKGWISSSEYLALLKDSDVFIHSSIFEPFGIPPLDAMAYGKLVIVSDGIHSTKSIIKNGYNGFIYRNNSPVELFDIIANLDKTKIHKLGQQAAKDIKNYYEIDHNIKVLKDIIDSKSKLLQI